MKALIVSYKRGRHLIHPRHAIIKVPGIGEKARAQQLVGTKVVFTTKSGKVISGKITRPHGIKGLMRARFVKGLPGQAIGQEVALSEKAALKRVAKKSEKKAPEPKAKPKKAPASKKKSAPKKK